MKWFKYSVISLLALFASCISDDEMEAGKKVAVLMGAEDFSVGVEKTTEDGSLSVLTIKEFSDSGKGITLDQITSFAALNFVNNLEAEKVKINNKIKIVIDNDTGKHESIYVVKDIVMANDYFAKLKSFLSTYVINGAPFNLMDTSYIPASDVIDFFEMEKKVDRKNDQQIQFAGFKYGKLEIDQNPTIVVWINRINEGETLRYTFYLLLKSKKIIHIGIETIENGYVKKNI